MIQRGHLVSKDHFGATSAVIAPRWHCASSLGFQPRAGVVSMDWLVSQGQRRCFWPWPEGGTCFPGPVSACSGWLAASGQWRCYVVLGQDWKRGGGSLRGPCHCFGILTWGQARSRFLRLLRPGGSSRVSDTSSGCPGKHHLWVRRLSFQSVLSLLCDFGQIIRPPWAPIAASVK